MIDLQPKTCPRCDFGSGYRGMDRCAACDGTGSGFWVGERFFPNTEEGHKQAEEAASPISEKSE